MSCSLPPHSTNDADSQEKAGIWLSPSGPCMESVCRVCWLLGDFSSSSPAVWQWHWLIGKGWCLAVPMQPVHGPSHPLLWLNWKWPMIRQMQRPPADHAHRREVKSIDCGRRRDSKVSQTPLPLPSLASKAISIVIVEPAWWGAPVGRSPLRGKKESTSWTQQWLWSTVVQREARSSSTTGSTFKKLSISEHYGERILVTV